MAGPYSQDLRDRVIDAVVHGGMSRRGAAERLGISDVNRHHELTPPPCVSSMLYRADRRRNPTPIDTLTAITSSKPETAS